jgi:hypothetical protein
MNLDDSESSSDFNESEHEYDYVLSVRPKTRQDLRFPPPETMHHLWEIFVENFDPLTKIVHVPTLRPAFEKAVNNTTAIPRSFEALMFAIFSAAVLTLKKDDECQQKFGQTRQSVLAKYTAATEAALARAKFMATTSLVVLQALVIHLFAVRDKYEPRAVWTLTGIYFSMCFWKWNI